MSYIGNEPTTGHFPTDTFISSGGSTYTLGYTPATTSAIEISVQGVVQNISAYSVNGTTLTLVGVASGDSIFVRHLGETMIVPVPGDDTITTSKILDGAVTAAKIDSSVSLGGVMFPSGTKLTFYQASAPTGWTQDTTASLANRSLRIVTGSGGGTGGTHDLDAAPSPSHTHTGPSHTHAHSLSGGSATLSIAQLASHNHSYRRPDSVPSAASKNLAYNNGSPSNSTTGSVGSGSSHTHAVSGSISADGTGVTGSGGAVAFAPKYVDVIIASKDV